MRNALIGVASLSTLVLVAIVYLWTSYGRQIDAKLSGEQRPAPRIFGRPVEVVPGQSVSRVQLIQRLNDVGYVQLPKATAAGEFSVTASSVIIVPRTAGAASAPKPVRIDYTRPTSNVVSKMTAVGGGSVDRLTLEAPLLAALAPGERRRYVPLASIPKSVVNAVIAIEDRRFYEHPGIDPIGIVRAIWTNMTGSEKYLVGGSTLTQQFVKNTFLTPEKSPIRKMREQFMAVVLETRFTKDQILELYLNDVVLGQRGPFEIHGVAEAARVFFGKDVRNVSLAEAATIAGIIQTPSRFSPFRNPDRARDRRNVVLGAMADNGFITAADAEKTRKEPLVVSSRAFESEAPYFVDYVSKLVDEKYSGLLKKDAAVDVYTTLDLHMQRLAQEALADGMTQVDKLLAGRKRQGKPQAALVAVDPRTGDILAMVGGRAYNDSQYNRAMLARRQPGSTFKPFVYLAAFERTASGDGTDLTPASIVTDEATTFKDGENDYTPSNYQNEYDGPITLRRALAHSRNIAAIKVAEAVGYDRVADLWSRTKLGAPAKPFPSIALGVFEATPLEMTEAYTLFTNGGAIRPLQALTRIVENNATRTMPDVPTRPVARADTTYLVTNMMRSVLNEGTGAGARSAGFALDAAGKTGTTNDLRDAWFIGFTPGLLTVVWVGFDNNQPIGLSGAQAALPIWTSFMKRALAGAPSESFDVPPGVEFASIDPETGQLATPDCPKTIQEAFLGGTVPTKSCELHGGHGVSGFLSKMGGLFSRIVH